MSTETLDDALTGKTAGLFRKLAEVMGEVGRVEKRGRNTHFKYEYVTEADLVEAVRGKLTDRNVAFLPSVIDIGERPNGNGFVTTVKVQFTFADGDTGATFSIVGAGQGFDGQDKGVYKALTGATKYVLMKTFLIATGDDPEADHGNQPAQAPQSSKPATDKQKALRSKLLGEKAPTVAQIKLMLNGIGVQGYPDDPQGLKGFVEGLDGARTSAFIEALMELPKQEQAA